MFTFLLFVGAIVGAIALAVRYMTRDTRKLRAAIQRRDEFIDKITVMASHAAMDEPFAYIILDEVTEYRKRGRETL